MARVLRVLNLKIRTTADWQDHEYDLDAQVVVIYGPADTGKSSVADAIAFAMGVEDMSFRGVVDRHLREVVLTIRLGNRTYTLTRRRHTGSRVVQVRDEVGDLVGRFPVEQRAGEKTMSDWLCEELGIAEEFSALGAKSAFHTAIWPYLYRDQFDIDRHIIMATSADQLRLDTLQIMTGITEAELARRRAELKKIDGEIKRRKFKHAAAAEFLSFSQATDPAAVRAAITDLTSKEAESAKRLDSLRTVANAALAGEKQWSQRRRVAYDAVGQAEKQLLLARRELDKLTAEVDEVDVALQALGVLEAADPADRVTLELVSERTCPQCAANLLEAVPPPGHCNLCWRPLKGQQHLPTRIALQAQRQGFEVRLPALTEAEELAHKQLDAAHCTLETVLQAHHEQTEHAVAPHVDAIAAAAAERAALRQRLTDLRQVDAALQRLEEERRAFEGLKAEQQVRYEQLRFAESGREHREFVAETLTDIFRETIDGIGLPNATGRARIDPDTLLPLVDEQPFESRGGGARVAVSVAYSLTLLTYTLETEQSLLPGLLIIDSPQKNLGNNQKDQELARRVYQKFLDALHNRGTISDGKFERPFQLIIIDNDRPKVRGFSKVHKLDYGDGFLKKLDALNAITDGTLQLPLQDDTGN